MEGEYQRLMGITLPTPKEVKTGETTLESIERQYRRRVIETNADEDQFMRSILDKAYDYFVEKFRLCSLLASDGDPRQVHEILNRLFEKHHKRNAQSYDPSPEARERLEKERIERGVCGFDDDRYAQLGGGWYGMRDETESTTDLNQAFLSRPHTERQSQLPSENKTIEQLIMEREADDLLFFPPKN